MINYKIACYSPYSIALFESVEFYILRIGVLWSSKILYLGVIDVTEVIQVCEDLY